MTQVAGITLERTMTGKPVSITFNFKKWGSTLQNFFLEKGIDVPFEDILKPNNATEHAINNATTSTVATLENENDIVSYLYNR